MKKKLLLLSGVIVVAVIAFLENVEDHIEYKLQEVEDGRG